jgi:ribosomal protein S2
MGKVTLAPQISTQIRDQKSPDIQKENKKVKEAYKQEQRGKNLQKYIQEIKGASKKLLPRHKVLKTRSPRLEFFLKSKIRNTAVSPKDSRFKDLYAKLTKRVKTWYKNSLPESKSLLSTPVLPGLLPNGSLQDSPDLHQLIHGKDLVGPTFVGVLERNKILNPFLYGHTGGLEILDIDFLIPQMKRVRSLLLLTFLRKGNILIISNDPLHSQILQEVSKRSKRFLVVSKWTHGLLTNWKQVQPHFFQKHSKKKLFKDTKEYLKLCNRNRTKIHQKGRLRLGKANCTSTEFTRFGRDLRVHRDTKVYAKDGGSSSAVSAKSKPKLSTSLLAFERLRSKPESKPVKPSSSKLVKGVKKQSFGRQPVSRKLSKRRLNKNRNLKKNKNLKKKKILYLKVLKWKKTRNLKSHGVAPPRFTKVSPKKALRGKDFLRKKRFFLVSPPKKKKKLALPTFVLVIDPDEHQDAILEARKIKIPIISFLPLGAKAHSVDYLLPVPGELTDYLYWFCQQLVNWKYQAKQMALDLEEIYQKKKLQRKKKMRRTLQIRKKTRNKKKRSLRILKTLA